MTIDERLERLTDRHEALTQSVELMVTENRERDRRLAEMEERWDERMGKLIGTVEKLVGTVEKVAQIAANHEHRIERLEG